VAWYRKRLSIPAADAGKSIFLDVDGAMSYATVWLNGQLVGGWPFGYASWRLDLTPHIVPGGVNQLAIRLDNPPSSSRWYPGGGLYRNVWLTKTPPLHVGHWGTSVRSRAVSTASATIDVDVTIDNDSSRVESVRVATSIYALDDAGVRTGGAVATIAPVDVAVAARSNAAVSGSATIGNPRLWGPPPTQRPQRYVAVTAVSQGERVLDSYDTPFGVRELRFDANQGLLVNGERVVIKGVNQHHDLGALGAAFNMRAAERQLEILQEMGANAIRTAHNPPAPELLDLTDRMGFLVVNELFDGNGVLWPRGFQRIRFTVDGPGEIVATDNGNPASFTPFQSHEREAFNGLALVIVRARPGATGSMTVKATAEGVKAGVTTIRLSAATPGPRR
jgi:beta-galactosidase